MTLLTRTQSLSSPPLLKTEKIPVPEFGEGVELAVRGLTARQRWEFGQMASKSSDDDAKSPEPTSYLITKAAIDENGQTLFQTQDCDNIAEWPGDLVDRIGTVIMKMSGLSPDKDAEGNGKKSSSDSEPTKTVSGPTESPETSDAASTS